MVYSELGPNGIASSSLDFGGDIWPNLGIYFQVGPGHSDQCVHNKYHYWLVGF